MNWNDELCGVKVTPESWAGGVVAAGPPWGDGSCWRIAVERENWWGDHQPIFPPRGWASKTDTELWAALAKTYCGIIGDEWWINGDGWIVRVGPGWGVSIEAGSPYEDEMCGETELDIAPCALTNPSALILALQNAQVLARRLA